MSELEKLERNARKVQYLVGYGINTDVELYIDPIEAISGSFRFCAYVNRYCGVIYRRYTVYFYADSIYDSCYVRVYEFNK